MTHVDDSYNAMRICSEKFFEAFRKSVDRNDYECIFVSPPADYLAWLEKQPLPNEFKEFLIKACFEGGEYDVGAADFFSWERVVKENDEFSYILRGGFCIIGAAGNGDMVGVDWMHEPGRAGFLSHDDLWVWDADVYPNPREHFTQLSASIGEFALMATDLTKCPIDYYGNMADLESE